MYNAARDYRATAWDQRRESRRALSHEVRIADRFLRSAQVRLVNISPGGFSAEGAGMLASGDPVWISLPGIGVVPGEVCWRKGDRFGAAFDKECSLRLKFINGLPRD